MSLYLEYADYDLVCADGSHLSDFQPPNEEREPPPLLEYKNQQQNFEETIQWLAEEQQEHELEGQEVLESEGEEEEEINIIKIVMMR
jgi:hypothetical protein